MGLRGGGGTDLHFMIFDFILLQLDDPCLSITVNLYCSLLVFLDCICFVTILLFLHQKIQFDHFIFYLCFKNVHVFLFDIVSFIL